MRQKSEVAFSYDSMQPPNQTQIEARVKEIGQQIFKRPAWNLLKRDFWYTKLIDLSTQDLRVKTQLFRFVDVLPVLVDSTQRREHLLEYLSKPRSADHWPLSLRLISGLLKVPGISELGVKVADSQVRQMAQKFIVGEDIESVIPRLEFARSKGIGFTLDILGESVLSDDEAALYQKKYFDLIERMGELQQKWKPHPLLDQTALGSIPPVNLSIKISSLDCRMDPMAFESSLQRLIERIEPILQAAVKKNIFINFDMEQFALKDLTRELFRRLILKPEFKTYRHFGVVVQAYLKSSRSDVDEWIKVAQERGTPFTIRLVKGAYWDYEVIVADQNAWEIPVYLKKQDSDANYEDCTRALLDAYPLIELAVGSHNVRSIAFALAYAEVRKVPLSALEVQMLYGMADPFKESLVRMGVRVREYAPFGEMLPGLSYLVRRLLENSSNDSFLKQSFMNKTKIEELLSRPH